MAGTTIIEKNKQRGSVASVIGAGTFVAFQIAQNTINEVSHISWSYAPNNDADSFANFIGRIIVVADKIAEIPDITGLSAVEVSFFKTRNIDVLLDLSITKFGADKIDLFSPLKSENNKGISVVLLSLFQDGIGNGGTHVARLNVVGQSSSINRSNFPIILDNKIPPNY